MANARGSTRFAPASSVVVPLTTIAAPRRMASGMTRHRDQAAIRIRNRYAALHVARLEPGDSVTVPDAPFAHVYLARGRMDLEAEGLLGAGDAARLTAAGGRRLDAAEPSEVLIWEMHASLSSAPRTAIFTAATCTWR